MKFKLARQILSKDLHEIIEREVKRQKFVVLRPTKKNLTELAEVSGTIQKQGFVKHLVRKKLSHNLGHGIFLHKEAQPVAKGQMIAPYAGAVSLVPQYGGDNSAYVFDLLSEILLTKEEQALFDKERNYHPRRRYSLILDAYKQGNFTRYINHSSHPNIIARYFKIPTNSLGLEPAPLEIIYMAKKTILPGEQLLVSYEDEEESYWGPLKIKPFPMTPQTFQLDASLKLISTSDSIAFSI